MTDEPGNGGLGLSGARRLERIELTVDRTNDKIDNLGNEVSMALRQLAALKEEQMGLDKRVRALELRFYGILAGLVTAVGVILWQSGNVSL
jgi:hypothetical protein